MSSARLGVGFIFFAYQLRIRLCFVIIDRGEYLVSASGLTARHCYGRQVTRICQER